MKMTSLKVATDDCQYGLSLTCQTKNMCLDYDLCQQPPCYLSFQFWRAVNSFIYRSLNLIKTKQWKYFTSVNLRIF